MEKKKVKRLVKARWPYINEKGEIKMEVFMPYLYNPVEKITYFEIVKDKGFQKLLPESIQGNK
jgi:hypothetical protein